ncbi:unnamed protein product [Arabidopsis halleri]
MEKCNYQGDVPSKEIVVSSEQQNQGIIESVLLTPPKGYAGSFIDTILIKEEPPDSPHHIKIQGEHHGEIKRVIGDFTKTDTILFQNQEHGVKCHIITKDKPPDSSKHSPTIQNRGNYLNSQKRMKPNLLSLGAGKTVLRSKLSEEGGYDVDIRTKPDPELTRPAGSSLNQTKPDQKGEFWRKPSSDQENGLGLDIYKEIHPKKSNGSDGIINHHAELKLVHDDSPGSSHLQVRPPKLIFPRTIFDIHRYYGHIKNIGRAINEDYRSISPSFHESLPRVPRIQVHQSKDIFTRPILKIHRPESNFMKNRRETCMCHRARIKDGRETLHFDNTITYPELFKETCLSFPLCVPQSHIWKPGDPLHLLEAAPHDLWCTFPHLIMRRPNLPYSDPRSFNSQRLIYYQCCCVLKTLHTSQSVPRSRTYLPKLSRYKIKTLTSFGPIFPLMFQRLYSLKFAIVFLF